MSSPKWEPGSVEAHHEMIRHGEELEKRQRLQDLRRQRPPGLLSNAVVSLIVYLGFIAIFLFGALLGSGYLIGHLSMIRTTLSVLPDAWWQPAPGLPSDSPAQGIGYWIIIGVFLVLGYAVLTALRFTANRALAGTPAGRWCCAFALTLLRTMVVMLAIGLFIVTVPVLDPAVRDVPGGDLLADRLLTAIIVPLVLVGFSLISTHRSLRWRNRKDATPEAASDG